MTYDEALIAGKLRRWEKYLNNYRLPRWEDIPDLGLYMEQVVLLLKGYLDYLPPELKDEQPVTAAAINNYVRNKYMPVPKRKKYYRIHIAYLIMICTLKQSLSIATMRKMLPLGLPDERVHEVYDAYIKHHRLTACYFVEQVKQIAGPILEHEPSTCISVDNTVDLITTAAIASGLSRLLAEKLLLLDGRTIEDGGPFLEKEDN